MGGVLGRIERIGEHRRGLDGFGRCRDFLAVIAVDSDASDFRQVEEQRILSRLGECGSQRDERDIKEEYRNATVLSCSCATV